MIGIGREFRKIEDILLVQKLTACFSDVHSNMRLRISSPLNSWFKIPVTTLNLPHSRHRKDKSLSAKKQQKLADQKGDVDLGVELTVRSNHGKEDNLTWAKIIEIEEDQGHDVGFTLSCKRRGGYEIVKLEKNEEDRFPWLFGTRAGNDGLFLEKFGKTLKADGEKAHSASELLPGDIVFCVGQHKNKDHASGEHEYIEWMSCGIDLSSKDDVLNRLSMLRPVSFYILPLRLAVVHPGLVTENRMGKLLDQDKDGKIRNSKNQPGKGDGPYRLGFRVGVAQGRLFIVSVKENTWLRSGH